MYLAVREVRTQYPLMTNAETVVGEWLFPSTVDISEPT